MAGSNVFFATSATHRGSIYFFPFPGSVVSRHGRVSPDLGQPSGLRVPSGGCHPRIIARLRASTGTGLTLVTLHWAQRPWFSDLVQLSLAPPMILPSRLYLLLLTRSRHLYPDLSWLRLHAWRLSSAFQRAAGFSSAIAEQSALRAVHPRAQCIRYDDPFVMGNVTPMAIPFISYLSYGSWFLCSVWYAGSLGVSCGVTVQFLCGFPFSPSILIFGSVLRMLLRSFQLSSAECVLRPHTWDLSMVLPI